MNKKNTIFLISGPSGVGKDSVIKTLNESNSNIKNIETITTRKKRGNEIHNKDYIFVSKKKFENLITCNKLIEWSEVYGNYYGVPKDQIENNLNNQNKIIIKTDIQGIKKLKQKFKNAVTIFIMKKKIDDGNIVGQDIGKTGGFNVFSVNGSYQLIDNIKVSAGIDNLFDVTYAEHISRSGATITGYETTDRVNEPGRTFWLQLQAKI